MIRRLMMNSSVNLSLNTLDEVKAISDQHHNKTFQPSRKMNETSKDTNKKRRNGLDKLKESSKL